MYNPRSLLSVGVGRDILNSKANDLTFFDARSQYDGGTYEDSIVKGAQHAKLQDISSGADAFTIANPQGKFTPNIVLKANFFGLKTRADQDAVLAHELLHYALNLDDGQLIQKFGLTGMYGGSSVISNFLEAGCDKSKMKLSTDFGN